MKKELNAETEVDSSTTDDATMSSQNAAKPNIISRLFYFDQNSRVYEMDGVKKSSPFHLGYFRQIKITGENDKEFICEYGVVDKKSRMYSWGSGKFKTYTEQEMLDDVYVQENRHKISERVRNANAFVLHEIENLLAQNGL